MIEVQKRLKRIVSTLFEPVLSTGKKILNDISTSVMTFITTMSQYLSLNSIVDRIVTKHKSDSFGGFRSTILDLIDTSIFETNLLTICNKLFADDNYRSVKYLKYVRTRSLPSPKLLCPICNTKISQEKLRIILFSCGHGYHSKCIENKKQCVVCYGSRKQKKKL